jgi:hypothetical protein
MSHEQSRKLKAREKDINSLGKKGPMAYHAVAQNWCVANLGGIAERKIMYMRRDDIACKGDIAIWEGSIPYLM